MGDMNWENKCFVATVYLVQHGKVLLTWNKRLSTWIPVGGHLEKGETPEEAVRRETLEETGMEFSFVPARTPLVVDNVREIPCMRVQIDEIPGHNQHINFVFAARVTRMTQATQTDELEKLRWFTQAEIHAEEGMLQSVRQGALEALKLVY